MSQQVGERYFGAEEIGIMGATLTTTVVTECTGIKLVHGLFQ